MSRNSTCDTSGRPRACSMSVRRRRRRGSCARNVAGAAPREERFCGSSNPPPWSTTTISTAWTEDFGSIFLKFRSYFPYNAKLCINGHEYLKRQLTKRGVAFEPLDNGIKSCADPKLAQRLCDGLSATKIDQLLRKWLRRLPHPFPPRDRAAAYRYQLSILQAE